MLCHSGLLAQDKSLEAFIKKSDFLLFRKEKNANGDIISISSRNSVNPFIPTMRQESIYDRYPVHVKIEYFKKYSKLKFLSLSGCEVVDMSGLSELKDIEYLDLSGTRIKNFAMISSHSLKKLNLSNAKSADNNVFVFSNQLPNLRELSLDKISPNIRIIGLDNLNLKRLYVRDCENLDLVFLRECRISELYMDRMTGVVDLDRLKNLPIRILHLGRMVRVKNIQSLQTLSKLQVLDISLQGNLNFSFKMLSGLPLKRLKMWHHTIIFNRQEAYFLSKLPLNELSLFEIIFDDLQPVLEMPLQNLELNQLVLPFNTLQLLAKNISLRRLQISHPMKLNGKPFYDFPWRDLQLLNIAELDLSHCSISDWGWVHNMSHLKVLILPGNMRDLKPLSDLHFRMLITPGLKPEEKLKQMKENRIICEIL